jgi:hypothetical protein
LTVDVFSVENLRAAVDVLLVLVLLPQLRVAVAEVRALRREFGVSDEAVAQAKLEVDREAGTGLLRAALASVRRKK